MLLSEKRSLRMLTKAERLAAAASKVVMCIAIHERDICRNRWGCSQSEFFPMSLPIEEPPARGSPLGEGDMLRLLHIGRIDGLASFRSLQFLFEQVFPR